MTLATDIKILTDQIIDTRRSVFALVSALANQSTLDAARLSQDFVTAARLGGADVDNPTQEMRALLTVLQIRREGTLRLPIAEQLLRSGVLQPGTSDDDGDTGRSS